jgi:hypothetical protein
MSLQGWEALKCPNCNSEDFLAVHNLKWREGQGSTSNQSKWKCAKCSTLTGTSPMIDVVQKIHLQKKIDELTEQQRHG